MNHVILSFFFFFGLFLFPASLFASPVDANIHFVWMRAEDATGEFFIKTSSYQKIDGALKALSVTPRKFRGESPIAVYRKDAVGNYTICGKIEIPAGVRDCAVVLVPEWEAKPLEFAPKVLELPKSVKGGELVFCNLTSVTMQAKIRGNEPEKFFPDEIRRLYALGKQEESGTLSFKILAAAASAEAAKRSWRYANSIRLVSSQHYYLVALPGKPKDDPEKPPQFELITLRRNAG